MRLVTFRSGGGARLGVVRRDGAHVVEVGDPAGMLALIDAGDRGLDAVREAVARGRGREHALEKVELLPPLPQPRGNVIAIGRNYEKHAAETAGLEGRQPSPPTIFTKAITSLVDPFGDIAIDPAISDRIDWEVELGIVVGKTGANIKRAAAMQHVFGYVALNDVTARDIQADWGGQYFKGKSLDRTCPTGPWIVTADEVPDPQTLGLRTLVNGTVRQNNSTAKMIWDVSELIAFFSTFYTLKPGVVIETGTPGGTAWAGDPELGGRPYEREDVQRGGYLQPGDVVTVEIDGIGSLSNPVVAAP